MDGRADVKTLAFTPFGSACVSPAGFSRAKPAEDSSGCFPVFRGQQPHVLLLGIQGSGIRALAEILMEMRWNVTASDLQLGDAESVAIESARWPQAGTQICGWHEVSHLLSTDSSREGRHRVDLVVSSAAVPADDPRLDAARKAGTPCFLLSEAVSEIFRHRQQICVAGTHGKTTTTGLIWWILQQTGKSPGGFIGGLLNGTGRSGFFGSSSTAVIESCEFRESFQKLSPGIVVLSGIDRDHFDCFPNVSDEDAAFERFLSRLDPQGTLIVNGDCTRAMKVADRSAVRQVTYGIKNQSGWSAADIRHEPSGTDFTLTWRGKVQRRIAMAVPGRHNVLNALGAIAAAEESGCPSEELPEALRSFPGIRRRFERRGSWQGMELIDDFAHHPGAIRETLAAVAGIYPGRRRLVVFEPHQMSRMEHLFTEFAQALKDADECLILPVLAARESCSESACSRASGRLVREINCSGGRAFLLANLDQVTGRIDHAGRRGDVVITMGAGRTNQIHDEFNRRLQRDFAA